MVISHVEKVSNCSAWLGNHHSAKQHSHLSPWPQGCGSHRWGLSSWSRSLLEERTATKNGCNSTEPEKKTDAAAKYHKITKNNCSNMIPQVNDFNSSVLNQTSCDCRLRFRGQIQRRGDSSESCPEARGQLMGPGVTAAAADFSAELYGYGSIKMVGLL